MRHSLLMLTLLAAPAHAELNEHGHTKIHSPAWLNATMPDSLIPSSDLFEQALCWLPTSSIGKNSVGEVDNCIVEAIHAPTATRQSPSQFNGIPTINWSVINYPAISSGAWSFIPDIGYQFLLEKTADTSPDITLSAAPSGPTLSAMPLAALTWFMLGCILGSLAMMRRSQEKLAIATK